MGLKFPPGSRPPRNETKARATPAREPAPRLDAWRARSAATRRRMPGGGAPSRGDVQHAGRIEAGNIYLMSTLKQALQDDWEWRTATRRGAPWLR